jgi:hypothetical protein
MMPSPTTSTDPGRPRGKTTSTNDHHQNERLLQLRGPRRSVRVPLGKAQKRTSVQDRRRRRGKQLATLAETATPSTRTPNQRPPLAANLMDWWSRPDMLAGRRMTVAGKETRTTSSQEERKSLHALSTWRTGHSTRCSHTRCLLETTLNVREDVRGSIRNLRAELHHRHAYRQKTRSNTSRGVRVAQLLWCEEDLESPDQRVANQRSYHAGNHHVANRHVVSGNEVAV